jgi:hypothetical protein
VANIDLVELFST